MNKIIEALGVITSGLVFFAVTGLGGYLLIYVLCVIISWIGNVLMLLPPIN